MDPRERALMISMNGVGLSYGLNQTSDDLQSIIYKRISKKDPKKESKIEKSAWALQDITFQGWSGDIIGLIGANGSGKTTVCKVISKLLKPDKGNVSVNGRVTSLLSLGTGFNNQLTGRENIYLNGMMLGLSNAEVTELLPSIIEFSELSEFIDEPVRKYSLGMKARLAFSAAVMVQPDILVIDEALNAGDLEFNRKAAAKMQEMVKKAAVVLIVTHQIDFVEQYCTKAVWIENGTVRMEGGSAEIAQLYRAHYKPKKVVQQAAYTMDLKRTLLDEGINAEPIIKAANLSIRYKVNNKEFWALKGLDLDLKKGEILGIIGRNGAGKSTLCMALSGILKPDAGELTINGETSALLSFGTGFNDQLVGRDNVYLNGMMLGIPRKEIDKIYDEIISFSGLENYQATPLKNYSSGMRARLGFSIATMINPDLFIIDEALSVGDQSFYEKASARIQEMIMKAKAVVVVTHSMDFVEKVCTKALWINKGEAVAVGEPVEVVKMYKEGIKR